MRILASRVLSAFLLLALAQSALGQTETQQPRRRPQLPDKFTNLQVLPKDISKDDLVDTMRLFSHSLGVHCDFCHQVSETSQNWASDKKDEKNAARNMMRMVDHINAEFMPKLEPLPGEEKKESGVNCWTCHRGHKEPEKGPPPEQEHRPGPPPPGMGPNMGQQPAPPS
ncbi:MAG TPA: c-type cytochrome [Terriglobales bacterium]|nr:c-type cytochrome [Terriglobales bacterium]